MKSLPGHFVGWLMFLVILLVLATLSFPQSFFVRCFSESDGLPSTTVHDMVQDQQGRIWFATRSGIAVYDGISWKTFKLSDGLPVLAFSKIGVDRKGRIWALSDSLQGGIYVVYCNSDGDDYGETPFKWNQLEVIDIPAVRNTGITAFQVMDMDGEQNDMPVIAVGTMEHGVFCRNRGKWTNITRENGLLSNTVNGLALLKGKLYAAGNRGISIISMVDNNFTVDSRLNRSLELPSKDIKGICIEFKDKFPDHLLNHSRVWLFGHDWLGYFEEGTKGADRYHMTIYPMDDILFTEKIETVALSPDYRCGIYVSKLYRTFYFNYETRSWQSIGAINGLISEGAHSIFTDFEKNIWIACRRGVSRISSRRFNNFQMVHGLLEDEVTGVVEYEPGKFVLGHNIGITIYDGKEFLKVPFSRTGTSASPLFRVLDMQLDSQGHVWIAAARAGLGKINPYFTAHAKPRITWYDRADGLSEEIISLWIDKNTDKIWVGTSRGIFRSETTNESKRKFVSMKIENFPLIYARRLAGDSGKLRYITTSRYGLYEYNDENNQWQNYRVPGDENANDIYAVKKDSQGRLLLGTLAGVFILENNRLKKFKENNFQVDRQVYFILEDHRKRLWFGTDNGVIRWDGKEARTYSTREGLIGQETNRAAGIEDSMGRVWIGTYRGVSIYDENFDDDVRFSPPPKIQLLYMEVSGKKIPLQGARPMQLDYNDNTITFYFRGISFLDETAIRFKSKLEGLENKWSAEVYLTNQMIKYPHLPSGTYRFYLKAGNAQGKWSNVVTSPEIIIPEPFYKKWWFYPLLFLVVGLLLLAIFQFISGKRYAALLEKQVEERSNQLQAVEQRYRSLFEESKDAVFISTPQGKFTDINPAGVDLFGFQSRDQALTLSSGLQIYNSREDQSVRAFREEIERKGYVKDYETIFKRMDGEHITALVTATLVRDKEGNISAYRGIIRDITDKKRLEQQLTHAQKMEAIGTLAGGVAHNFNNLLGVIMGNAELLTDDIPQESRGRRNIQDILDASERAAELVWQILAFSRQSDRKRSPINLSIVIKEVLKLLRATLPTTIEIRQDIRDDSGIVMADPVQIHQVIMNLGANASHAMQKNEGILEVSLDEVYVDRETAERYGNIKNGPYLKLNISDTGHGMPPEVVNRIFDPYFTTKKVGEGTGMGLAVVHGIVKSHGGYITVHSQTGKGTCFHIYLPEINASGGSEPF